MQGDRGGSSDEDPGKRAKAAQSSGSRVSLKCLCCQTPAENNGINWARVAKDERLRPVPDGPFCVLCGKWCNASPFSEEELVRLVKSKTTYEKMAGQRDEFVANTEDPLDIEYPTEQVKVQDVWTSQLYEDFDFIDKELFHDQAGVELEKVKELTACKALNKNADMDTGVVQIRQGSVPTLRIMSERKVIKEQVVLEPEAHLYADQASDFFKVTTGNRAKLLGQQWGNKYVPKKEDKMSISAYTPQQVAEAIRTAKARLGVKGDGPCGLASSATAAAASGLRRGSSFSSIMGSPPPHVSPDPSRRSSPSEGRLLAIDDGVMPEGEGEPRAVEEMASVPRGRDPTPRAEPLAISNTAVSEEAKPDMSTIPTSPMASEGGASSGVDALSLTPAGNPRRQPPKHWHNVLVPFEVFNGRNFGREISFAEACVARTAKTSTVEAGKLQFAIDRVKAALKVQDGLSKRAPWAEFKTYLADAKTLKLSIPTTIELQITGLYVYDIVTSLVKQDCCEVDKLEDALIAAIDPFPVYELVEGDGDDEPYYRALQAKLIDLMNPMLKDVQGTFSNRLVIAERTILNDVFEILVRQGESGQRCVVSLVSKIITLYTSNYTHMEKIHPVCVTTVKICKVMLTMAQPASPHADVGLVLKAQEAFEKGEENVLADVRLLICNSPNKYYKEVLDDLMQKAAQYVASYQDLRDDNESMATVEIDTEDGLNTLENIMQRLKRLRVTVRRGDTLDLELKLQTMLTKYVTSTLATLESGAASDDLTLVEKINTMAKEAFPEVGAYVMMYDCIEKRKAARAGTQQAGVVAHVLDHLFLEDSVTVDVSRLGGLRDALGGFTHASGVSDELGERLLEAGRKIAQHIAGNLVANIGHISVLPAINRVLDHVKMTNNHFNAIADILKVGASIDTLLISFSDLGDSDEVCVERAMDNTVDIVDNLSRQIQMFDKIKAEMADSDFHLMPQTVDDKYQQAQRVVNLTGTAAIEKGISDVIHALEEIEPVMNGGKDGESWASKLKTTAKLPTVIAAVREALTDLVTTGFYDNSRELLNDLHSRYKDVCSRFQKAPDEAIKKRVDKARMALQFTYCQYLIMALIDSKKERDDGDKVKKVHAIQKKLRSHPPKSTFTWDDMQPALKKKADALLSGGD